MTSIKPIYTALIPGELDDGILYISKEYQCAIHLCCCGCGREVVTPLDQKGWKLTEKDGMVTLSPSIGSFNLPCRSHYFIRNDDVVWC